MASPLLSRAPQCISCVRNITASLRDSAPGRQQIRGKRKLAKVTTVKVHLLQNVPGYGRKGTVIPVTTGVMRNIWYPKGMAEYLTEARRQEIGIKKDAHLEREYTFKSEKERKLERQIQREAQDAKEAAAAEEAALLLEKDPQRKRDALTPQEPRPQVELDLLSPDETMTILENVLPTNLDFYRTPTPASAPKRVSPSISANSVVSTQDRNLAQTSERMGIYGSVSTSDIAANLKAILAEDEASSRVVLSAEDIQFVQETDDKDRVKHLGVFEIEIRVEGATDSVRRTIKVNAQD